MQQAFWFHRYITVFLLNETYLLAGIQLFGQFFYEVFSIRAPQSGRAHAVVHGHHRLQKHTSYINTKTQHVVCVCGYDICESASKHTVLLTPALLFARES